jgi:cell division septum initiation protein DivIVA
MHLIDLEEVNAFVDDLLEKMTSEDVVKLKTRLKSLSKKAPVFKNDEEEIDLAEMLLSNGITVNPNG